MKQEQQLQSIPERQSINQDTTNTENKQEPTTTPTGIPKNLQASIEYMTGVSLANISVHYNSSMAQQQGVAVINEYPNIYIAPNQEQQLSKSLWETAKAQQHTSTQEQESTSSTSEQESEQTTAQASEEESTTDGVYFTAKGHFLGQRGSSGTVKIITTKEPTLDKHITAHGLGSLKHHSQSINTLDSKAKEQVYYSIYKQEKLGGKYKLLDIEYVETGYYSIRHKTRKGGPLGVNGQAFSWFYKDTKEGIIVILGFVSDNYYDMAKTLRHENNHNIKSAKGVKSGVGHGYQHFLVEKEALEKYRDQMSEDGLAHSKTLIEGYLQEHIYAMQKVDQKSAAYREVYKEYEEIKNYLNGL